MRWLRAFARFLLGLFLWWTLAHVVSGIILPPSLDLIGIAALASLLNVPLTDLPGPAQTRQTRAVLSFLGTAVTIGISLTALGPTRLAASALLRTALLPAVGVGLMELLFTDVPVARAKSL
jgi:hypothetical protein